MAESPTLHTSLFSSISGARGFRNPGENEWLTLMLASHFQYSHIDGWAANVPASNHIHNMGVGGRMGVNDWTPAKKEKSFSSSSSSRLFWRRRRLLARRGEIGNRQKVTRCARVADDRHTHISSIMHIAAATQERCENKLWEYNTVFRVVMVTCQNVNGNKRKSTQINRKSVAPPHRSLNSRDGRPFIFWSVVYLWPW